MRPADMLTAEWCGSGLCSDGTPCHTVKNRIPYGSGVVPVVDLRPLGFAERSRSGVDTRVAILDLKGNLQGLVLGADLEMLVPAGLDQVAPEDLPVSLATETILGAVRLGRRFLVALAADEKHAGGLQTSNGVA